MWWWHGVRRVRKGSALRMHARGQQQVRGVPDARTPVNVTLSPLARWKHIVNWIASQQRCSLDSCVHSRLRAAMAVVKHWLPRSTRTSPASAAA